ncbi:MAG: tetratricopeptide repeat protein [Planktothrix sp. GU0601_MAG3]|nr:MAG: tetratricopeptide repeat protein [Planktothrix sp. GU0601_MAG3]
MKYLNFFEKLSPINQNKKLLEHGSTLFKNLHSFSAILENEELMIFYVLLNWAVDDLEDEEIYCQFGVNSFSTLIAALLNHPDCMAYAVDSFYEQNNSRNYEDLVNNLDNFNLTEQVFLFDQDPEEFLLELKTVNFENTIGVFVYDWKKDYRSVLYSLLSIKFFLSDQSLIIIEGVNHPSVQQAIADFLTVNSEFIIEKEFLSQSDQYLTVAEGRVILSRDINRNISLESSVVFNYRQPQIIKRISQVEQLEDLLETIYQDALSFHQEHNFNQAENKYKDFLKWNKHHLESWINLSKLYYQTENYQESLQAIFQVIEIDPERFEGYYNLGKCLEKMNQIPQAIAAYKKTIELKPDYLDAYNNLGNLLTQQGQFIEAETLYRQGININPNHFGSYLNLGNLFLLQNQIESALENYQIALQIIPNNPDILNNLELAKERQQNPALHYSSFGDRLYELGNYQGAIAQYQKLLDLQQGDVNIYEKIHQCYWNLGEYDSAINVLKIATELDSKFAPLHFTLITNLIYQGRTEEAATQAKIASECLPKDYTFILLKNLIVPMFYHSVEEISDYQERFNKGLKTLIETTDFNDPETLESAFLGMGRFTNFYLGYQARNIIEEQRIYGNFLHQMMSAKYPQWVQPLTLPTVENKIRVGYVSNYLHCYSGSLWLTGWLRYANPDQFEIYSYYTGNSPDPITDQFRQYSYQFYHIPNNLEAVAEQIFKDKLHILVYPEIGMNPPTMELAALRLAPIQCTAWGHPVTSGLPTIDYFLSSQLMETGKCTRPLF